MAVYARSDVSHVAISAVHGGCGKSHSRPVHNGAPVQVWELSCPQCEDHLRSDPLWAPMPGQVPETPDEKVSRESSEKRTQLDLERSNAEAFTQLANAVSGNATAMQKLVELMAMMSPAAVTQKSPVPGEVLSRAREVGSNGERTVKNMGEPLIPVSAPDSFPEVQVQPDLPAVVVPEPVAPAPEPAPAPAPAPKPAPPAPESKPEPAPEPVAAPEPEPGKTEDAVTTPKRRGRPPRNASASGD